MIDLMHGDCLDLLPTIADNSVDMVLCDPPYQITACKWDSVIPFEPMWKELKRIVKKNGAMVFTASQPFTSALVMSNIKMFKYCWVWDKKIPSGMSYARFAPMIQTEDVVVFGDGRLTYNAQMILRDKPIKSGGCKPSESARHTMNKPLNRTYTHKNPTTLIQFAKTRRGSVHPTQKPVALMEYMIKTYTNEGETVLDFAMGSGTTGVAARNLNRNFIGIEKDEKYFEIAKERILGQDHERKDER